MSESQADDCLKRGQEISVAGEQNESVILPAEGQVHQVHSDGHVNALFLGRLAGPGAVVELSADDLDPGVARPPRRLRVVGGRDHGLMVRVRAPSVDADRFGCAGTLASARDQVRNPDWIGNAPVQFAAAVEEATADEVNVLEVKEDRDAFGQCAQHL